MLQARQNDLFAGLGDLAGKENFVEDSVDLVTQGGVGYQLDFLRTQLNAALFSVKEAPLQKSTHLVEIENQIQLAHIPEKTIQDLYKEMNGLQVGQLVIVGVNAHTEE